MKILKPNKETKSAYEELKILTLDQLIELEHNKLAYKITKGHLPKKIKEIINCDQNNKPLQKIHKYNTRKKSRPNIPQPKTKNYTRSFLCNGIRALNELPPEMTSCTSLTAFVKKFKQRYVDA